jgi:hypothetical protein
MGAPIYDDVRHFQFFDQLIGNGQIIPLIRSQLRRIEMGRTPIIGDVRERGSGEVSPCDFAGRVILFPFLNELHR